MFLGQWALGVDLGGTKIKVAQVDASGVIHKQLLFQTEVQGGPAGIKAQILHAANLLQEDMSSRPIAIGIGVPGQIEKESGVVCFAPNLPNWNDVPLQADIAQALQLPTIVLNDVRSATWGESFHGAGQGCTDLLCVFLGTGIGSGIISGGHLLGGSSNSAGEIGHMTIDLQGRLCHCGNRGCLETIAGGWGIAKQAQEAVHANPIQGMAILALANGNIKTITAKSVIVAAQGGDPLARELIKKITEALIGGMVSIINAFNPHRLILGGGIIDGIPELIDKIRCGVKERALKAATAKLEVLPAQLKNNAGVIGAATIAMHAAVKKKKGVL